MSNLSRKKTLIIHTEWSSKVGNRESAPVVTQIQGELLFSRKSDGSAVLTVCYSKDKCISLDADTVLKLITENESNRKSN